jgi:hypothetical protein
MVDLLTGKPPNVGSRRVRIHSITFFVRIGYGINPKIGIDIIRNGSAFEDG